MIEWFFRPSMVKWNMPQTTVADAIQDAYHAIEELQDVVSAQNNTIKELQTRIEALESDK